MDNTKTEIGHVITNPPRAVQVRTPGPANATEPHSAVVSNVTILTDNRLETQALLDNWAMVADAINEIVLRILAPTEPTPGE